MRLLNHFIHITVALGSMGISKVAKKFDILFPQVQLGCCLVTKDPSGGTQISKLGEALYRYCAG